MNRVTTITLINKEKVTINLNVTEPHQTFVRMGAGLIAGVTRPKSKAWWAQPAVFIWTEVNGIYRYAGDVRFSRNEEDGKVCPHPSLFKQEW